MKTSPSLSFPLNSTAASRLPYSALRKAGGSTLLALVLATNAGSLSEVLAEVKSAPKFELNEAGNKLFSGGGTINCDIEIPSAGKYALTARVTTVQDNPNTLLTVNMAKQPIAITEPYTIGKWEPTPPVEVALAKGKNSLRFSRPEGSRGLTIKEFTLTPVK